jgi:hypothetical protein
VRPANKILTTTGKLVNEGETLLYRHPGTAPTSSGANLNWLVKDKDIAPHIPVIDKSKREDGTFSRVDFTFDKDRNVYI